MGVVFSPDGQRLVTMGARGAVVWEVPDASGDPSEDLATLAEAVAGYRADDSGVFVPLAAADRATAIARLRASSGAFVRAFLARHPSP